MFEYQAEIVTRSRYNFESSRFSVDSICFDHPNVDENGNWEIGDDVFISISPDMSYIETWNAVAELMW